MFKRILSFILTAALAMSGITACGRSESSENIEINYEESEDISNSLDNEESGVSQEESDASVSDADSESEEIDVTVNQDNGKRDLEIDENAFAEDWSTAVDAAITVKKLTGARSDFIYGVDLSSYRAEVESGVKYYDYDGNELDDQGFFNFLAKCGVNTVRIRLWNDPTDGQGHTYGGGHNDLETAKDIGLLATQAGMKVLLDFHYSDFWADPGKQSAPKAWANMDIEEKAGELCKYTCDSLVSLAEAGVDIDIIQIGNEITNGLCGETNWANKTSLLNAGVDGIKSAEETTGNDYRIAVHFTNPENGKYNFFAQNLKNFDVDYDIFASSYYPYWHGTTEDLTKELTNIADNYGKDVMVVETSYIHTYEDGDGSGNTESEGKSGDKFDYEVSPQGQADAIYAVADAVRRCGNAGLGICYWEPAWIPVNVVDWSQSDTDKVIEENKKIWEEVGSGWATSYSGEYDDDAAEYYGGSAVDNEAWFDFYGHPLASAMMYSYLQTGSIAPLTPTTASCEDVHISIGEEALMPTEVNVRFNDGSISMQPVEWDSDSLSKVDTSQKGEYSIDGNVTVKTNDMEAEVILPVTVKLIVEPENLLVNGGFEDQDMSMWQISSDVISRKEDQNNVKNGVGTLHFWSDQPIEYVVEQKLVLDAGTYTYGAYLEGGDAGDSAEFYIYISIDGEIQRVDTGVTKWQEWQNPELSGFEITEDGTEVIIGLSGKCDAKGWGAWDDLYLYKN
ncbi:MAG: glycosyl hydrolase 53 family protein [Eubacterium sp.]|nr:glycosyl hydrolase 53 family protein [Eubacterium sp.]